MKIIGTTDRGYIVEMDESDMAALVGETYFGGSDAQKKLQEMGVFKVPGYNRNAELCVGAIIPLGDRFNRMRSLEYKHVELKDVGKKLRTMADLLDGLGNAVIVPPKAAE